MVEQISLSTAIGKILNNRPDLTAGQRDTLQGIQANCLLGRKESQIKRQLRRLEIGQNFTDPFLQSYLHPTGVQNKKQPIPGVG